MLTQVPLHVASLLSDIRSADLSAQPYAGVSLGQILITAAVSFMGYQLRAIWKKVEGASEEVVRLRHAISGDGDTKGIASRLEHVETYKTEAERTLAHRIKEYQRWQDRVNASLFRVDPTFSPDSRLRRRYDDDEPYEEPDHEQ